MNLQWIHLACRQFISHEFIRMLLFFVGDNGGHPQQPHSNVLSAAQTLALALQQCNSSTPSPSDKETAEIINAWLESFMPVSICCCCKSLKPIESIHNEMSILYMRCRPQMWLIEEIVIAKVVQKIFKFVYQTWTISQTNYLNHSTQALKVHLEFE